MSPRRISVIAAVLITFGGAVAIANQTSLFSPSRNQLPAEQLGQDQGQDKERDKGGWLKDLNLTSDQLQKIQVIRDRYKDQFSQQRQATQQAQRDLRELMAGDASSEQIRQKYKQVQVLKQQYANTRFNSMVDIREILTPEQRQKFVNHMKELRLNNKDHFKDRFDKDRFDK